MTRGAVTRESSRRKLIREIGRRSQADHGHKPTVCSTHAIERRARRRIATRITGAIAIGVALHAHPALDVGIVAVAIVATVLAARALVSHRRRFTLHASLARPFL